MKKLLERIALGGGAVGLTGLFGLAVPAEAKVPRLTAEQCRIVSAIAVKVVKAVGPDTLSPEFRQSFRDWLGPEIACDGPKEIRTPTPEDVAAFNTIRGTLLQGPAPISLSQMGVRAVP